MLGKAKLGLVSIVCFLLLELAFPLIGHTRPDSCQEISGIVYCMGDQSNGVNVNGRFWTILSYPFVVHDFTGDWDNMISLDNTDPIVLNIKNLSIDITPEPGRSGIKLWDYYFGINDLTVNFTGGEWGITTMASQSPAPGIYAKSQGWDGGTDDPSGLDGGKGFSGFSGGNVTVNSNGNISTTGDESQGIYAVSLAGDGGDGGNGLDCGILDCDGGKGGAGGNGSTVSVSGNGSIETSGNMAHGVLAVSQAGDGGDGGEGHGIGSGGDGGQGGKGGDIYIDGSWDITTYGSESQGIVARSHGGKGGAGDSGGWLWGGGGTGGSTSDGGTVIVNFEPEVDGNGGTIETFGDKSHGIFAQSIGGFAGSGGSDESILLSWGGDGQSGGSGGEVDIFNKGIITTHGEESHAIYAQSLGGGGGSGGSGGYITFWALGASGNAGGDGGRVTVFNRGQLTTLGEKSYGIYAQSVGGGGGDGGASSGAFSIGGDAEGTSNGNDVHVVNWGNIKASSSAIFAQSIGGGGGNGGSPSSLLLSIGGSGSGGGVAGGIFVSNWGNLETIENDSSGIFAQSLGGGGGNGGDSFTLGLYTSIAIGGNAAVGSDGSEVHVSGSNFITTKGDRSHGILAQSVGSGGGNGGGSFAGNVGPDFSASFGIGGTGGGGGDGGDVFMDGDVSIKTDGEDSHGIFTQSVGGGGGFGGLSTILSASGYFAMTMSFGGSGGKGGKGGNVTVGESLSPFGPYFLTGDIITKGDHSHGILAQSVGGGGGNGGLSIGTSGSIVSALAVSFGGKGGDGGDGGSVFASSGANITTEGKDSHGIFAQSVGGGGGSGGFSLAAAVGNLSCSLSLGGSGGEGGHGLDVNVGSSERHSTGKITTSGDRSYGILAQSVGGGGGDAGMSISGVFSPAGFATPLSIGGTGNKAGNGNLVNVYSDNEITTQGKDSHGIFAQSIGGGGGSGELSLAGTIMANNSVGISIGGSGAGGGNASNVMVHTSGAIETAGDRSSGIKAQSLGGGGGDGALSISAGLILESHSLAISVGGNGSGGGNGGKVNVNNIDSIHTLGHESHGIFAQSIGGGGGSGGDSYSFPSLPMPDEEDISINLGITVGGSGGVAGDGEDIEISNNGNITTEGALARGIFAQSIGGGGGNGGNATLGTGIGPLDDFFTLLDPSAFGMLTVGGGGGSQGSGGTVIVDNTGEIKTSGYLSHGIFAQSVGGGGGEAQMYASFQNNDTGHGGDAGPGLLGILSFGGNGGTSGDGGDVTVSNYSLIETSGDGAYGIYAQSVGGGGGSAGSVVQGMGWVGDPTSTFGLGLAFGGDGVGAGDGGSVTVINTNDIITRGADSHGIFAQSVGGGGGAGGGAGNQDLHPTQRGFAGSVGGDGSGGKVTVTQEGNIITEGDRSHGIFAQSAGGGIGFFGDDVDVTVAGNVTALGSDSHGILAQSRGNSGAGNISISIVNGTVQGGSDSGSGVYIMEGSANSINNYGTVTNVNGVNGNAIVGTVGDETINNYGIITGNVDLGGGSNVFNNMLDATFNSGMTVDMGIDNMLYNMGTLSPGGTDNFLETMLFGDFTQSDSGILNLEIGGLDMGLDPGWQFGLNDILAQYDRFNVTGTATLAGMLDIDIYDLDLGEGQYTPRAGDYFDIFMADTIIGGFSLFDDWAGEGLNWALSCLHDYDDLGMDILRLTVEASPMGPVPEPATMMLFGTGLVGVAGIARRRKKSRA